ncbi:ATP-dependent RNA helicase A-like [Daktulosphaira vitifoliae]|uniref:ATP-dependent RNA helicase A-like n=1 Tax=Daktulosphaira vitifoliae TaxID=58002 RepID=UPI0021AA508C|nr:ATP-dependent RNA helicase A-like [Daktulosphaira vitifoliae]
MKKNNISNAQKILLKWCSINNLNPDFNFNHEDDLKNNYNEICKLTVPGHNYVGIGVAKNRSKAIKQACQDYAVYLQKEFGITKNILQEINDKSNQTNTNNNLLISFSNPLNDNINNGDAEYIEYKKFVENLNIKSIIIDETDCLNENAVNHGNWTTDVAKSFLNTFIKINKISNPNYIYTNIDEKCFVAKISIFILELEKEITGCQVDKNKDYASKRCAVSVVRQLFHLGIVDDYTQIPIKEILLKEYKVNVQQKLVHRIYDILDEYNIKPVVEDKSLLEIEGSISLIPQVKLAEYKEFEPSTNVDKVISWSPPNCYFNAWTSTSKLLTHISLDEMSLRFSKKHLKNLSRQSESILNRSKLPIFHKKNEIISAIGKNTVVLIKGSTGCGKTTQVCQFILDEFIINNKGAYCNIICSQPRKLSAISVAKRIAYERKESIGDSVGYSIRFDSVLPRSHGSILVCTDGILMSRLENGLHGISHIIVDEVHERHANTDFLMIILKDIAEKYHDIRIILMSATIDTELFSKYFNNCPVIEVIGTCYPVKELFLEDIIQQTGYCPTINKKQRKFIKNQNNLNCNLNVSDDYTNDVKEQVAMISEDDQHIEIIKHLLKFIETNDQIQDKSGAILIFLPGWDWIISLKECLLQDEYFASSKFLFLPLHSILPTSEQEKVFQTVRRGVRKVILATNIAETSITIEDVVYVIDHGKARINVFTAHDNTSNFVTVWVSKANKKQRMGRAGRIKPGYCFHLCSKARYEKLDDYIVPEIVRIPLVSIGLQIKLLKLGDMETYLNKAIEPPSKNSIIEAQNILQDMKCLGGNFELTTLGLVAAKLSILPNISRMIILASFFKLGDPINIIAAIHSDQGDIFIQESNLSLTKQTFSGKRCSDQVAMLKAFYKWQYLQDHNINDWNFCQKNLLYWSSLTTSSNIRCQLTHRMIQMGFPEESYYYPDIFNENENPNLDLISGILTAGYYPNICKHDIGRKTLTKSEKCANIHKSSVNFDKNKDVKFPSPFFVFADKLQTGAIFSMQMTMITPIHMLLFGAHKIVYEGFRVVLDDWIYLKMDVKSAAAIVALRPIIDQIMVKVVEHPECIIKRSDTDRRLIQILKDLCNFNAGRHNMSPIIFDF